MASQRTRAISTEILALFETIREQAHAYAQAFAHLQDAIAQLQQERQRWEQEMEAIRTRA